MRYFDWLARRFDGDQPFVAYHAGLALLSAARELPPADLRHLASPLAEVEDLVTRLSPTTDRVAVVRAIRRQFDRRTAHA